MAQMPQIGERRTAHGETREWNGTGWQLIDAQTGGEEEGGIIRGLADTMKNTAIGAVKGAGQTATNLGNMVNKVPVLGDITEGLGNALGTIPSKLRGEQPSMPAQGGEAFRQANESLEPEGTAQKFGKTAEQIGEFLIPGASTGRAATSGLARMIPGSTSPQMMKVLNQIASVTGRVAGDAAGTAGVGMVHGDPNVDAEAAISGGTTALAHALPLLLSNPALNKILSIFVAGRLPGAASGGLAGRMGTFGILRNAVQDSLDAMGKTTASKTSRPIGRAVGRLAAGTKSETEPRRRPLMKNDGLHVTMSNK